MVYFKNMEEGTEEEKVALYRSRHSRLNKFLVDVKFYLEKSPWRLRI
jgi:hypothetical protein